MQFNITVTIPEKGEPIIVINSRRRKEQPPRQCLQCSGTFIPFRANQRFCNQSHGSIYRKNMAKVKSEVASHYKGKNRITPSIEVATISKDPFYRAQLQKAAKKRPGLYRAAANA